MAPRYTIIKPLCAALSCACLCAGAATESSAALSAAPAAQKEQPKAVPQQPKTAVLPPLRGGNASVMRQLGEITADRWSVRGRNVIAEGNVRMPYSSYYIRCDKAVVNLETRDLETYGNVEVIQRTVEHRTLQPEALAEIQRIPDVITEINGIHTSPLGEMRLDVTIKFAGSRIQAEKFAGNMTTGYFQFKNAVCQMNNLTFKAAEGERLSSGDINLKDAEVSTCEYLASDNAHYSVSATSVKIYSHQTNGFDPSTYDFTHYEHSMLIKNAVPRIYGVPVFYLPYAYRPKDESLRLFNMSAGRSSEFGFHLDFWKSINITDYPFSSVTLLANYYQKRGFGYGADINIRSENSKTRIFAYSIYDMDPQQQSALVTSRLGIPNYRFDVTLNHVSHLTETLDLRASVNYMSDAYFERDFFSYNYASNPEPATYVALEKQFHYATTSLYVRARTNSFQTTTESLPRWRIDVPRQELFGTGLYYQGSHELSYLQMKWRDFDERRPVWSFSDPENYSSMRLDTVNFLYYPFKLDFLNIVPRAGVRMTYYTNSSRRKVSEDNLGSMFLAESPSAYVPFDGVSYDNDGGGKVRFIGEFGVEASAKFYRTWQDVRSPIMNLDGLRHVVVPYIGYTYITPPSEDRDYLYYFDDTDRITMQNYFRFGLQNRLQTRSGGRLREFFSMENYWDLHVQSEGDYNPIGDFCTKLTATPMQGLAISTLFSINAGNNSTTRGNTVISGDNKGRSGISGDWLNRWMLSITYEPIDDFVLNLSYAYQDSYLGRSTYAMGTTISQIESGSYYDKWYFSRTQQISAGISLPLTPDRRTRVSYKITYDFDAGVIRDQVVGITQRLHCWEAGFYYTRSAEFNADGSTNYSNSFSGMISLTGGHPLTRARGKFAEQYRNLAVSNAFGGY